MGMSPSKSKALPQTLEGLGWLALALPAILTPSPFLARALLAASVSATLAAAWGVLEAVGLVSFGLAAPFGSGAYAAALALKAGAALPLALATSALVGPLLHLPLSLGTRWRRVSPGGFAVLSLAWAEMLGVAAANLGVTGGPAGILLGTPLHPSVAALLGISSALAASGLLWLARGARLGPPARTAALHPGAPALGLPVAFLRDLSLGISGGLAGLAGGLYALALGLVDAGAVFSPLHSALAMVAAVVGLPVAWGPAAVALYVSLSDQVFLGPAFPSLHALVIAALLLLASLSMGRRSWSVRGSGFLQRPTPPPLVRAEGPQETTEAAVGAEPLLKVEDLEVRRGRQVVVRGASFEVRAGEVIGVVGPNGSGKTTLLDALSGLLPHRGRILVNGRPVGRIPAHKRRMLGLARTFQVPQGVVGLSGHHLLGIGLRRRFYQLPPEPYCPDWIQLHAWGGKASDKLSRTELRKLELARAILSCGKVMLLDEPGAGLDPLALEEVADAVGELAREGKAVVLVEHVPYLVKTLATRTYRMSEGRLVELPGRKW